MHTWLKFQLGCKLYKGKMKLEERVSHQRGKSVMNIKLLTAPLHPALGNGEETSQSLSFKQFWNV
jgi:hypothetical protein